MRKVLKITARLVLVIIGLVLLLWLLLQTSPVQNFIIKKVTAKLSKDLQTEVSIRHVSITFFNRMNLEGTLIRDKQRDTLLAAGAMKVRITDWFFWRTNIDLKYIGLEDAVIKLQRKDSVWNYAFIADHFAPKQPSSPKKNNKPTQLNLEKVDLKNVSFLKNDLWHGECMNIKVGSLLLDADKIDFSSKLFDINKIEIDKPFFAIEHFDGLQPAAQQAAPVDTGLYFNDARLVIKVDSLKITNGKFYDEKLNAEKLYNGVFDSHHLRLSQLNGTIYKFSFINDTIKAAINLSAKDRSGLELRKLKAQFKLTPQILELASLDLRTNKSHIGNYFAMQFKDFVDDLDEFETNIVMNAHLRNTTVSSDDIAYLAPELKSWKKEAELYGNFTGTVANFSIKNFFLRNGFDTYISSGAFAMKGLPDIDKTQIDFNDGVLQTTYGSLSTIIPAVDGITVPNLKALGKIIFTGTYHGTIHNFTTNGNFSTAVGGLYTNINLKLPLKTEPAYNGTIITKQFNLGKFLNAPSVGVVDFKGKINGSSFAIDKIQTSLDGTFDKFDFNNYTYTNLIFNGTVKKKFFNGEFKASDPNFDFTSTIEVDLSHEQPRFNVLGDLAKADFKKLKLTNQNIQLTGLFDLNFSGKNIDNFIGTAKILNASVVKDSTRLNFDSLVVSTSRDSSRDKVLSITSNEFAVNITGQYNILGLPVTFQSFLNKYYPAYINPPSAMPKNQAFQLSVTTGSFEKYAQLLDTNLKGLNDLQVTGHINTQDSGTFYFKAAIPEVKYKNYSLDQANIEGTGDYSKLSLSGNVYKAYISDSTFFPNTAIKINSSNDHSDVHIATSANNTLNDAQLNADVYTLPDGVRINFQPSSFVINEKKWNLEKQGEIIVRKNFASAQNVKFTQGLQEITVVTELEQGSNKNDLAVKLSNVNLGDFTPIFTKKPSIEGVAKGSIYLRDFYSQFHVDADINAAQFRLDKDSVGVVQMKASFDSKTGNVDYNVISNNQAYNFNATGRYATKDSTHTPLYTSLHLIDAHINIVNEFLGTLFTDIQGRATGDLVIKGNPSAPDLLGNIALHNAAMTVIYTQVRYHIDTAQIAFKDGLIDFGEFKIKDNYNNTGTVRGKLYEKGFDNMNFDFDMATNKLLMLNTTAKDNQQFYGKAIGKATLSLKGPEDNMRMSVTGTVNDTTHIFIPTTYSKESAGADFIVFKKYGKEIEEPQVAQTKLNIDLDLTATNQAEIDVILDALTGDVIRATGNGHLQINVPATGNLTMKGRYNVERGSYDFNFQSFIRKPFEFQPDAGNFIEWNGDPYNANIHIDAQYTASRVTVNDLISNQGDLVSSVRGYRGDVYVIAELRGKLNKPDINFRLDFPAGSPIKNDQNFALFLARMQSDNNEMLKQVTYLIVFSSFAPYGNNTSSATNITTIGVNTISQLVSQELNKIVSNILFKITGDKNLQLDVNTSTYSSSSLLTSSGVAGSNNKLDRQSINLKLNKSLLDGKVIVTFGGDFDFNLSNAAAQTNTLQWLPDLSVQIVLSRDRKLRAVIFNKSSLDVGNNATIGRRLRQGVSLSYTKDFESIFARKPKDSTAIKKELPELDN